MIGKITFSLGLLAALLAGGADATSVAASGGDGSFGIHADTALAPMLTADVDFLHAGSARGDAKAYSAGLMLAPPTPVVHWGVGARYRYQDTQLGSGGGVELGASVFVATPVPRVSVGGVAWYLPSALANGDVRRSYDYSAQVRLAVTRATYLWAGYRRMQVTFEDGRAQALYKGPTFGVSVGF